MKEYNKWISSNKYHIASSEKSIISYEEELDDRGESSIIRYY